MHIESTIRAAFRKLGLDLHRFNPKARVDSPLASSMLEFGIDLVIDVGANKGQFVSEIRRAGYSGRIISFEPLSESHAELAHSSAADSNWEVFERCALGDEPGEVEINIAGNSVSSSILPMLDAHLSAAPKSAYRSRESAPMKTLDSVIGTALHGSIAPFLKIDTQGFEWQVLDGAIQTMPSLKGLAVELSLVPLYEGQRLWKEVVVRLEAAGFSLWCLEPVFSDKRSGRLLQMDGTFYRSSSDQSRGVEGFGSGS